MRRHNSDQVEWPDDLDDALVSNNNNNNNNNMASSSTTTTSRESQQQLDVQCEYAVTTASTTTTTTSTQLNNNNNSSSQQQQQQECKCGWNAAQTSATMPGHTVCSVVSMLVVAEEEQPSTSSPPPISAANLAHARSQYTNNSLTATTMCNIIETSPAPPLSSSDTPGTSGIPTSSSVPALLTSAPYSHRRVPPSAVHKKTSNPRKSKNPSRLFSPCFSPNPSDDSDLEDEDMMEKLRQTAASTWLSVPSTASSGGSSHQLSSQPPAAHQPDLHPLNPVSAAGGQRSPSPQQPSTSINQQFMSFLNNLKIRLKMPNRQASPQQSQAVESTRNTTGHHNSLRHSASTSTAHGLSFMPTARRQLADGILLSEQPYPVHTTVHYTHYLVPDLWQITSAPYYWGVMDRYEAEKLLENKPEGTFLLRDSAQCEYLFSVSFRRYNRTLHARIEQSDHLFSFDSYDPGVFSANTVTALIDNYKDPSRCLFFEPQLTHPLNRPFVFPLSHLCRASVINSGLDYDQLQALPVPRPFKQYLGEYHYKQPVKQVNH